MPTTTLTARSNARPSRLAFVLPTPDREALFTVIAKATSLWGGIYNPIVILDGSTRVVHGVQEERISGDDYLRSQEAILRAFDPDFLFTFSPDPLPDGLKVFQHRTYPAAQLDSVAYHNQIVSALVDVWPVLHDFWEQEFKFSATLPIKVRYPEKAEAEQSLLIAARFGLYANDDSYKFLRERFGATSFTYDAAFKAGMGGAGVLTPIRATGHHCSQQRQFIHSHAYFLMDPESVFDVVDYWNLRAAGMALVALTLADYKDFEPLIREFGAAAAYPMNEHVTNHVTLIKGRSITEEELKVVADWIRSLDFLKDFATMGWVPRFNMEFYGAGNEIDVKPIKAFESSPIAVLTDGYGSLIGPSLPFLRDDDPWVGIWSTDLSFYAYGQNDSCFRVPWLNAGCDALIRGKIGMGFELDAGPPTPQG